MKIFWHFITLVVFIFICLGITGLLNIAFPKRGVDDSVL